MSIVAILGTGTMGETLLSGLVRSGRSAADLVVTARRPERADELVERYGVRAMSNVEAAEAADTLVLVVKPQDMGGLVEEIRDHVRPGNLVVLVTPRLGAIPPSLYQHNPAFRDLAVPMPGRAEREAALGRLTTHLNLTTPLQVGTRGFADLTDALDGFTLRDVHQLVRLSRQGAPTTPEKPQTPPEKPQSGPGPGAFGAQQPGVTRFDPDAT